MAQDNLSPDDIDFLAQCEEEFKDRYTENDEDFMKVFNAEPSSPPIVENWWPSQKYARRNDRRNNRRFHPYDRQNDRHRSNQDRDYQERGHQDRGYQSRPSYRDRGNDNEQRDSGNRERDVYSSKRGRY